MRDVIRIFIERKAEIDLYFDFLEDLMEKKAQIISSDGSKQNVNIELAKILRANGFLLIYNVVESCVTQGIEAIYLDIIDKGVNYNDIKSNIQAEIINNVKNNVKIDDFISQVNNITVDIVAHYPKKIFSGNIDAKKIRETAKKYGFSHETNSEMTKSGAQLLTVKQKRNDLAHGDISFKECGQDYTIQQMVDIKNEVMQYLKEILDNIGHFLVNKEYLN
jgi:MAE_28990/MAE_18760-like HEPN